MNITQPARCLFAKASPSSRQTLRRTFHKSTSLHAKPSPKHKSIKASDLGLVKEDEAHKQVTAKDLRPYSESEKAALAKRYTPAQLAAIEVGEAAVDPQDLAEQATVREDPMRINYLDDFSSIHPVVDKPVRAPEENYDPNLRFKTGDELAEDLTNWIQDLPEQPDRLDFMKFMDNTRVTVGKEEAETNPRSYLAPEIPKLAMLKRGTSDGEEIDAPTKRLMRQTGFSLQEIRRFRVKSLVQHRVVNQTRLGKISSIYHLSIAGNGKGLLGVGEGKSAEPEEAKIQAKNAAIRNMQPVPLYEGRTIFGDVRGKVSATVVELMTRPPGFGVRCQSLIFEICRCAGIQDLAARVTRSRNHMNTVKATIQALLSQRLPEEVARARGRKLVDVRKVYYGGNL
ncbi:MAG: hypothetical protein Q9211_006968 [Gyalolechia sp. 1 TL-2023]